MRRPLGGRHASVVPALPEEYDGSFSYYERDKEKRGRGHDRSRDEDSDAAGDVEEDNQVARPSQSSATQPLYIHQEYSYTNERQNVRNGREEYSGRSTNASHPDSPAQAHRTSSTSPSIHRDQQYQFVDAHGHPHGMSNGSHPAHPPYAPASAPPVPPTFASIMNAYPEPSAASPPSTEFVHHNGGTPTGSSAPASGRGHRSRKSGQ